MLELGAANTSFQATSDTEKEQMTREVRAAVETAERLETRLDEEAADRGYDRVYKFRRIDELDDKWARLHATLTELKSGDDSSNDEYYSDDGDTEFSLRLDTKVREWTEIIWKPYLVSPERASERSEKVGTSSAPAAAAASGSYETTISNGEAASSTTAPPMASMSNGRTDRQSESCPICLTELVTQKVGTPEACNHSFCVDCLQEWFKTTNTCPIDRQVCDAILVRRCLEGRDVSRIEVVPPMQQEKAEEEEEFSDNFTRCDVCHGSNSFFALIYCDRCGRGYHLECVYPPLYIVPQGEWFCSDCC
jgi:hypothetical protein